MAVEQEHHIKMKKILEDVAEKSKGESGKLRKLAKSLSDHVLNEPALEDKILKAYRGYDGWNALKPCFDEAWFTDDEIKKLGHEINLWRNDLAHSKRTYEPKLETLRAVRLLEHFNYAIVLRQIGYEDEEIKELLTHALIR